MIVKTRSSVTVEMYEISHLDNVLPASGVPHRLAFVSRL